MPTNFYSGRKNKMLLRKTEKRIIFSRVLYRPLAQREFYSYSFYDIVFISNFVMIILYCIQIIYEYVLYVYTPTSNPVFLDFLETLLTTLWLSVVNLSFIRLLIYNYAIRCRVAMRHRFVLYIYFFSSYDWIKAILFITIRSL